MNRRFLLGVALVVATAFVTFKLTVVLNRDQIPGDPFYGYSLGAWIRWLIVPLDAALLAGCVLLQAILLLAVARRLNLLGSALWGAALGAYDACLIYPFSFNLAGYIERLPDHLWPGGTIGIALAAGILLLPIPAALGALALWITRRLEKPKALQAENRDQTVR